jgi:hypothetical protein
VHLLVDAVEVVDELGVLVFPAVDPEEVLGPVRLCLEQVVQLEPELLGELANSRVPLVD